MLSALYHKSTMGHLFWSVYAFGIRPQVHYGSLVLFSVYAFDTRQQVHWGSLALFNLSMLSALDNKPTAGHLFCSFYPCFRHWMTSPLRATCSILSVQHALGIGQQVHCGSLVSPISITCCFSCQSKSLCLFIRNAVNLHCTWLPLNQSCDLVWSGPRPGGLTLRLRDSWGTEVRGSPPAIYLSMS